MENNNVPNVNESGMVNISDDVVSIIASLAASSVSGVSGMVSSLSGGFAEFWGKKNLSKGVKVSRTDKSISLDLSIIVEYGCKIPDVAWEIQEKVKSEVEAMTGLGVTAVNIIVDGVNVPKEDEQADSSTDDKTEEVSEAAQAEETEDKEETEILEDTENTEEETEEQV